MTAPPIGGPPLSIGATGVILNPWYYRTVIIGSSLDADSTQAPITPTCSVDLSSQGVELFFVRDQLMFFFTGAPTARFLVNPLRYFISYKSFINYNLIGVASERPTATALNASEALPFALEAIVEVDRPGPNGEQIIYHDTQPATLSLPVASIHEFLRVLNPTLYYAIAFYLTGCENHRYFLVEFYKAVEAIKNAFGSEDQLLRELEAHGVTRTDYKAFGKAANDMRLAPLDIGRHAPVPGAPVYTIDLRNILVEPRSRSAFESSTRLCRQVIDGYIGYLAAQGVNGPGDR